MSDVVLLDGSDGEGGGQILRSALSLSLITGRPFRLVNDRARRENPGLRPQHLACLRGASAMSGGEAIGASVGSGVVEFRPGRISPGSWLLEVGTAGSTTLLLQCLAYPLALAGGGRLTLRGGTHARASPPFHYLAEVWLPAVARFGFPMRLSLGEAGFFPEGGGELVAEVAAASPGAPEIDWRSRGKLETVTVLSFVGSLPFHIAERQGEAAAGALKRLGIHADVQRHALTASRSRGSAVLVRGVFERTIAGFSSLGEKGKPAERVGREAAHDFARFLESEGAIDEHLGDQVLLPAALRAAGLLGVKGPTRFHAFEITDHLVTHARVIEKFLEVRVQIDGRDVSVG